MRKRHSGRKGRLTEKFRAMAPSAGDQIMIGIPYAGRTDIYTAAKSLGLEVEVKLTEKHTEVNHDFLPIFLVTFK